MPIFQRFVGHMRSDKSYSVILDTSFLIRLLSASDPLHSNAVGYFKYFLDNNIPMYVSTISIAEYCVDGDQNELPLRNLRIVPFNFQHAPVAGKYAKVLFEAKHNGEIQVDHRRVIPNDVKIFAQADCIADIKYFVTSDSKSSGLISKISEKESISFEHMDIHTPFANRFGILELSSNQ